MNSKKYTTNAGLHTPNGNRTRAACYLKWKASMITTSPSACDDGHGTVSTTALCRHVHRAVLIYVRVSRVAQRIPSPAPSHRVSACCIQSTPHARPSMKNKNKTTKFPVVRP